MPHDCPQCRHFRPDENPKTGLCAQPEGPLKPRTLAGARVHSVESRVVSEGMVCDRYQEKAA
jgi:hypothetical protein